MNAMSSPLRIVLISHNDDVGWMEKLPNTEVELVSDEKIGIAEIVKEYPGSDYDLYLIHPADFNDPNFAMLESPAVLFSGEYDDTPQWVAGEKIVKLYKNFLKKHWRRIVESMCAGNKLKTAVDSACHLVQENHDHDRHDIRNKKGALVTLELAAKYNHVSRETRTAASILIKSYEKLDLEKIDADIPTLLPDSEFPGLWPEGRFLMIDDQHRRGWSIVLGAILTGATSSVQYLGGAFGTSKPRHDATFFAIDYVGDRNRSEDLSNLWRLIGVDPGVTDKGIMPYDLVFLDYRAKDETTSDPFEISGRMILKQLHKFDPSLPVILVTGSEKARTVIHMQEDGLLSYFLKPDPHKDDEAEFNYQRLTHAVKAAKSHRYIRDLWNICLWIDRKKPRARDLYKRPDFIDHLKNLAGLDSGRPDAMLKECFTSALNRAVTLTKLDMKTDADCLTDGVKLVREIVQRTALVGDIMIGCGSPYRALAAYDQGELFRYCGNLCRVMRNMVSHPPEPDFIEDDLILQTLCMVFVMFSEDLPESCLSNILSYRKTDIGNEALSVDSAYARLLEHLGREHPGMPDIKASQTRLVYLKHLIEWREDIYPVSDMVSYNLSCMALYYAIKETVFETGQGLLLMDAIRLTVSARLLTL